MLDMEELKLQPSFVNSTTNKTNLEAIVENLNESGGGKNSDSSNHK